VGKAQGAKSAKRRAGSAEAWGQTQTSQTEGIKGDALDLLFPVVRAEVLRALFHHTRREMYVREIARWSGLALRTVQRELAILMKIGLVTTRTNGSHVFYRAMAVTCSLCRCSNWFSKARAVCWARENQGSGRDRVGENRVDANAKRREKRQRSP
jgi:DNA-binding transcriptional ArsR family regulator